jgi:hypothetical protein
MLIHKNLGFHSYTTRRNLLSAFTVILLVMLFVNVVTSRPITATDEDLVKQFFPQRLIDESSEDFANGGPPPFQATAFALADLNRTGANEFIVAAYSNGFSAAILVLKKQGDSAVVVDTPDLRLLAGITPGIRVIDLDNDQRPEIIVSFTSARGPSADWVFRWTGTALSLIGPTSVDENGDVSSKLSEADFSDLNNDGVLEIISPPQLGLPGTFQVFNLTGNLLKSLDFFGTFIRKTGTPVEEFQTFPVSDTNRSYRLKVLNGNSAGNQRSSSATIRLNGVVVVGPERLNQNVGEIEVTVPGIPTNTIGVRIAGAPDSRLVITVEAQQ